MKKNNAGSAGSAASKKVSEAELQQTVIEMAQLLRWRVAHFRPAMTQTGRWITPVAADGKGFPDLVLVRDRIIFAELKSERGRLTAEQTRWLNDLGDAGVEVHVWRPSDLDEIEEVLTRTA